MNGQTEHKNKRGGKVSGGRGKGAQKASTGGKGSGRGRGRPSANKSSPPTQAKTGKRGRPRKS